MSSAKQKKIIHFIQDKFFLVLTASGVILFPALIMTMVTVFFRVFENPKPSLSELLHSSETVSFSSTQGHLSETVAFITGCILLFIFYIVVKHTYHKSGEIEKESFLKILGCFGLSLVLLVGVTTYEKSFNTIQLSKEGISSVETTRVVPWKDIDHIVYGTSYNVFNPKNRKKDKVYFLLTKDTVFLLYSSYLFPEPGFASYLIRGSVFSQQACSAETIERIKRKSPEFNCEKEFVLNKQRLNS